MRSFLLRLAAIAAIDGTFVSAAHADDTWCVDNAVDFEQALDAAHDDDTTIKLRRGDYAINVSAFGFHHDLTLLGGYSDASCSEAGRSLDPTLTSLQPSTSNGSFMLGEIWGDLLVKSLTFRGYSGVHFDSDIDLTEPDSRWTLDRIRVENSHTFSVDTVNNGDVLLHQIVVAGNENGDCAAYVTAGNDDLVVQQSTFAHNVGNGLCISGSFFGIGDTGTVDIDNNIFWGNLCGLDVRGVESDDLHLRHNTIDCNTFEQLPSINVGSSQIDPQFLDPANGDYRPALTSPAINSGINPPSGGQSGTDIVGNPRVIGSSVDRGPWETDLSNATILFVSNANAAGAGSLTNAITQSNTLAGTQVIRFTIPGACPRIITQVQGQPLPDITDSVRIEGYSQPGSATGVPGNRRICVGVWGNQQLPVLLRVPLGADASLDVSGLGFGGTTFDAGAAAILLLGGGGHQISANQFGGSIGPSGNPVLLNVLQNGVVAGFGAHHGTIGGLDVEQANVFNSASAAAIDIGSTSTQPAGFRIYNNYIGVKPNGFAADANGYGIGLGSTRGNFVLNNWISGNSGNGVVLRNSANGNIIVANDIGRCPTCIAPPFGSELLLGNGVHGVLALAGATDNILNGNRIAGNGFGYAEEAGANGNALVGNRIYGNGGLGIDIGRDGVTPNDGGGINPDGVQNFPLLATAGGGFYNGGVQGSLNAAAGRSYTIEVYASDRCDTSGYGEGQRLIGRADVTTPASPLPGIHSTAHFTIAIELTGLDGQAISAIARGAAGDTSEFSPCVNYVYSDVIFQDGFD